MQLIGEHKPEDIHFWYIKVVQWWLENTRYIHTNMQMNQLMIFKIIFFKLPIYSVQNEFYIFSKIFEN